MNKSVVFYPGFEVVQCVHIPIFNDECLEDSMEFFNVSISSNDDRVVIGATREVEVYIRNDDGMFYLLTISLHRLICVQMLLLVSLRDPV